MMVAWFGAGFAGNNDPHIRILLYILHIVGYIFSQSFCVGMGGINSRVNQRISFCNEAHVICMEELKQELTFAVGTVDSPDASACAQPVMMMMGTLPTCSTAPVSHMRHDGG